MAKKIKEGKIKNNNRITDMKFKDLQKILESEGYFQVRRTNTTHMKFTNKEKNHSVVVSGVGSNMVQMPVVQKTLKAIGLR